jgi:hypothetical protein
MSVIYSGRAMPFDGKRKLSGRESQQRAKALSCMKSTTSTKCVGQIHIGVFFDGTGNNKDWKEPHFTENQIARNKHSNVARLWQAHEEDPDNGLFKIYIQGVGTPFREIGDNIEFITKVGGNGFAYMGADRINWGIISILQFLNTFASGSAAMSQNSQRFLVHAMSSALVGGTEFESIARWGTLTTVEEQVALAVKGSQRKVQQINISVFGFSRGAAEARTFCHWLNQLCEKEHGGFELAGVPIRIGFLGIFDTVAAVGVGDVTPVTFGHMAWAAGTQSIHPCVEECAHFIALHEQRASFPLESATGRGNVGYPGMHSDVGGGYYPGEQGRAKPSWGASPHLSQIPLLDMHFAALKAGVPMATIDEISGSRLLNSSFSTDRKLIAAYNAWLATNGIKAGHVVHFTEEHTKQYIRWRGMMHAPGATSLKHKRFYKDAPADEKADLAKADDYLGIQIRSWQYRKAENSTALGYIVGRVKDAIAWSHGEILTDNSPLSVNEAKFLKLLTEAPLPPRACIELFEEYVHDSRAGFHPVPGVFHFEPQLLSGGYARFRHVFLQASANTLIADAANESLKAVKAEVNDAVSYAQRLYRESVDAYEAARARIYRTARLARDKAVATAHKVEDASIRGAHFVHDESVRLGRAARDKAVEVGHDIHDGAEKAGHKAQQLAHEAGDEVERDARVVGKGAMRAANEAAQIYDAAQRKILKKWVAIEQQWREVIHHREASQAATVKAPANQRQGKGH